MHSAFLKTKHHFWVNFPFKSQVGDFNWNAVLVFACLIINDLSTLTLRPQPIELKTGGQANWDTSKMADMTVEDMTLRANQVTDEVCLSSVTIEI